MNQIVQTLYEQLQIRMPCEPCTYMQAAKAGKILYDEKSLRFSVRGDRFSGIVTVAYNEARDSYDIAFYTNKGEQKETFSDIYADEMVPLLWNKTFIV